MAIPPAGGDRHDARGAVRGPRYRRLRWAARRYGRM